MHARPHIAILGAGPVGLEAALAASELGFPFTIYEASSSPAGNVQAWGHVRLFTPWALNVSPRMARALAAAGQEVPDGDENPTGGELVARLLGPIAKLPSIEPHLRLGCRVLGVGREGLLKHEEIANANRAARRFRILLTNREGDEWAETADVVLDCTGTYGNPNRLGDGGIPAPGERALTHRVERFIPDFQREASHWSGQAILLVGAGHSAQTAARDLAALAAQQPGTRVLWALRGAQPRFAPAPGPDPSLDPLPERARLSEAAQALLDGASPAFEIRRGVVVDALRPAGERIVVTLRDSAGVADVTVDRVLSLTGGVGDQRLYRQLQVHECYAYAAPMKLSAALLAAAGPGGAGDCLDQASHGAETLTNPEPGFFLLGSKSYGRNNTFLLRVGWEQVGEVFELLIAAAA